MMILRRAVAQEAALKLKEICNIHDIMRLANGIPLIWEGL